MSYMTVDEKVDLLEKVFQATKTKELEELEKNRQKAAVQGKGQLVAFGQLNQKIGLPLEEDA